MIGRHHDLDALRRLLRAHRLVTLVGPGGVGKSRLAIEAARERFESDTIDVWIVELADVADPAEVVPTIMNGLDLPRTGSTIADTRRLTEFLKGRRALLVLDNCEHLVASAARTAQDLLESCPSLTIWATSREGLAIPSEVVWQVPPLPLDDAVALFIERGRAADPTSDIGSESEQTHRALATSAPGSMACHLQSSSQPRDCGRCRSLSSRQGSKTGSDCSIVARAPRFLANKRCAEWSTGATTSCSTTSGASSTDSRCSAGVVHRLPRAPSAPIPTSTVTTLPSSSPGSPTSRSSRSSEMSSRVTSVSGCCRRSSTTAANAWRRPATHRACTPRTFATTPTSPFAVWPRCEGEKQRGWLRAVTANLANLRAALDVSVRNTRCRRAQTIAGCLGWYWWFTGRAPEGSQWLALARSCPGSVRSVTRARLMAWTAFVRTPGFVRWMGPSESVEVDEPRSQELLDDDGIDALCTQAFADYREANAFTELACVETALAVTYSTRRNYARAGELLADAEQLLASVEPTPGVRAMHSFVVGRRAFVADRYGDAEAAFQKSGDLLEAIGAEVHSSFALRYAGRLAAWRGDHTSSLATIERALDLARGLGLSGFANVLMTDLGEALVASGDVERARAVLQHPLTAARDAGFRPGIAESLVALAVVEWEAEDVERAAGLAQEALDIAFAVDDLEVVAHCLAILGFVAERRGDLDEARARHTRALELARSADEPRRTAFALEGLACVALAVEDARSAARLLGAASAFRRAPGSAAGWAFAAGAHVVAQRFLERATAAAGVEAASSAFADGAADPQAVVADMMPPRID